MILSRYVGLLIQEMAVNIDLGFLLSIISLFTIDSNQYNLVVFTHWYLLMWTPSYCICKNIELESASKPMLNV